MVMGRVTLQDTQKSIQLTPTRVQNSGRIKAKFTIVNLPESRSFITCLSKLCFDS